MRRSGLFPPATGTLRSFYATVATWFCYALARRETLACWGRLVGVVFHSDVAVDEDLLRDKVVEGYAERLLEGVCACKQPLTLGILGTWGTGKSSLMRMMWRVLDEQMGAALGEEKSATQTQEKIFPVFFEAWRFEREANPLVALLKTIEITLRVNYGQHEAAWRVFADAALAVLRSLRVKTPVLDVDMKEAVDYDHTRVARIHKLSDDYYRLIELVKEFTRSGDRLVVLVDDLDRCGPGALDILESTKTIFEVPGISFVLGLDPGPMGTWLEEKYPKDSTITAERYLKKMITVPFYLPPHTFTARQELLNELRKPLDALLEDAPGQVFHLPSTGEASLREVKRIVNQVIAILAVSSEKARVHLLVGLVSLRELELAQFDEMRQGGIDGFKRSLEDCAKQALSDDAYIGFWRNFEQLGDVSHEQLRQWLQFLPTFIDESMRF